eukprot:COSAG04_NODE_202_length_20432_cov_7.004525_7_plen_73_part_00
MERPKWWNVLGVARDAPEDVVRQAAALQQQQQAQSTDTYDALPEDLLHSIACLAIYDRRHRYRARHSHAVFF